MDKLKSFKNLIKSSSSVANQELSSNSDTVGSSKPVVCKLHLLVNCKSCLLEEKSFAVTDTKPLSKNDDTGSKSGWLGHRLNFKESAYKPESYFKANDYEVIDPREQAQKYKSKKRKV
ncbi:hypothetical protein AYI69_g1343 [Smittium culicis]|uniref:Uncharacterized protein n=1 Tax=Smittium culicis TaxID=133412 RepID=A0A1R1YQJ6_9FUNG|nr:hypothetical protein AYI69_g1343 [Smittium culicis]